MRSKFDSLPLGLILGIAAPIITMLIIYFLKFNLYKADELLDYLVGLQVFTKIVSLCVIPNLLLFFIFIRKNYLYSARGVLMSTILFAVFVFITKFAL
jgi:ACR3 family arsenite efflux pump ArsB